MEYGYDEQSDLDAMYHQQQLEEQQQWEEEQERLKGSNENN